MRPKTVTVTASLMAMLNVLGYALLWDLRSSHAAVLSTAVIFTILIAVGYVVLWFYWRGQNWARILVMLTSILCLYNLRGLSGANFIVKVMLVGEAAVGVYLLYWLNTTSAKMYFKRADRSS